MDLKTILKQQPFLRGLFQFAKIYKNQYPFNLLLFCKDFWHFWSDYRRYAQQNHNDAFVFLPNYNYPQLRDKTAATPIDPIYFFQDAWAAAKIFETRPQHHYDVGSSVKTLGIISQFVPTTMVDIRAVPLKLKNFNFLEASILALPFADASIESLSSLCVLEHIGLGRYGDPIDPWGSEKAIAELQRVLAPGGKLFVSVPVDQECRIYFNAHRAFTRDYLLKLFANLQLVEEQYIYGDALENSYAPEKGFGTGLYYFVG
jgi:SAM-dependent methyltransferase